MISRTAQVLCSSVLALSLAGMASAAHGQTFVAYSHGWVSGIGVADDHTNTAAQPIGASSASADGHESASASSYAGAGYLRSISDTSARAFVNGSSAEAGSSASFTIDDLVFSGPGGGSLPTTVTLHLQFDGGLDLLTDHDFHYASASGQADVSLTWNSNAHLSGGVAKDSMGAYTRTGLLANYDPALINMLSIDLPFGGAGVNSLSLSLSTASHAVSRDPANASSSVQFGNTLKFSTSGPVFDLPVGWTVNSAQGNIVNNQFVLLASVPEPGSLGLVLAGLALVAHRHRLCSKYSCSLRRQRESPYK